MADSIYNIICTSINGEAVHLDRFRGQVMMIVNTASFCGFTPQFKGLEYLYRNYKARGFAVLGFPCNQFGEDPAGNERINDFCIRNYGVTFPMFAKVNVNGADADPLFAHLKSEAPGFLGTEMVKFNFTKFLVNRDGRVVARYSPTTFPRRLARVVEKLL